MNKIKIVADDKIPFLQDSPLVRLADLVFLPGGRIGLNDLLDADAVITRTRTRCCAETLAGTKVRFIATATIGYDHIDTAYCAEHGIVWKNAPGCNAASVAQYMASLLISVSLKHGIGLKGKVLGVVGAGNVGKKVIEVGRALGMGILVNDPPRGAAEGNAGFCTLETIMENADFITFHVPLSRDGKHKTFHLADAAFLGNLKRKPFLFNTSRGEVVDNRVLRESLVKREIAGASLDVWENEPEIDRGLLNLLDFATPHIAGYSTDGKANGTAASVRGVAEFFGIPGLENWEPETIPLPENPALNVSSLADAVYAAYDIRKDDMRLRSSPETFEAQRGNYPLRRELRAYRILNSDSLDSNLRNSLRILCSLR